jgi:two-component system, sensor histidine kinase ChiS
MGQGNEQSKTKALERINRELLSLYGLCAAIIENIDVAEFLQTLIERAGQILQVRSGSIVMPDPDGYLRIKAYFGLRSENATAYQVRPQEGRGGRIFSTRMAERFTTSEDREFHQTTSQENIEHTIGAPMIGSEGEVMGVLFLNDKLSQEPFSHGDLQLLINFANLAAIAVEKQAQLEEINRQKENYRQLNERLEASLRELNTVNDRLRESNRVKDEVLSICAHDVRSPLTAIISYAQLLLSNDNLSDKQRRYIEQIDRSSEKINKLVQNLLIRARYLENSEPLYLESVAIGDMAREALEQIEDRLTSKKSSATIIEEWDGKVRVDRFKIAQVFDNLLDNAVKFMLEGGELCVEIAANTVATDSVQIVISNPGEGIAPESLPRLFSRYFQAPSEKQRNGYGLGLAICKQNVDLHGGMIEAVSVPHERTSFRFTLPIGRPFLLVLSADVAFVEQIEAHTSVEWRHEVAASEKACIDIIRAELPTTLVIDASLNDFKRDLFSLLDQLRKEYEPSRLKIVVAGYKEPESTLEAAMAIFIDHPFTIEQLMKALL